MKGLLERANKPNSVTHKTTTKQKSGQKNEKMQLRKCHKTTTKQKSCSKESKDAIEEMSPDELANQAATIHITVRRHAAMTIQIKHGKKY